ETALESITQIAIPVVAAGRTDAGVHALGQVLSFRSDKGLAPTEWVRALNARLPPDIAVRAAEPVGDEFHARYSARAKLYEYRILNRPERSALDRARAWHLYGPLDVQAMQEAARALLGQHDFSSFEGPRSEAEDQGCDVRRLDVLRDGEKVRIEAEADRFLKQMVRAIVGTLVEIGQGKRLPASLKDILNARDRRAAGYTAPPHGLYLLQVRY
ncbi:MAG: tRNA pseudouridine(38-40) synthase TruA, partial [Nitrospirae bacterium]|nr:tRNA pseudouridine(38-40) synthase TruA [Nitrospirota bacterium]